MYMNFSLLVSLLNHHGLFVPAFGTFISYFSNNFFLHVCVFISVVLLILDRGKLKIMMFLNLKGLLLVIRA